MNYLSSFFGGGSPAPTAPPPLLPPNNKLSHFPAAALTIASLSPGDGAMQEFGGITTLTSYRDLPGEDAPPSLFLRERIAQIIVANPWLLARFITNNKKEVVALYPTSITKANLLEDNSILLDACFCTINLPSLKFDSGFLDASVLLKDQQVKKGKDCVDKEESLFKVCLITTTPSKEVMLLFSLSHTLGDGYTFYKLYSMLSPQTVITPMIFERVPTFVEDLKDVMGGDLTNFLMNPFTIFGFISNMLAAKVYPIKTLQIDKDKVKEEKRKVGGDHISTNDVITSWIINSSACTFGMMALNMRNRVKTVTDTHAGNYEGSLLFKAPVTPTTIREAVKTMRSPELPGYFDGVWGNSLVISNWSSFHFDLDIKGVKPVNHHPLQGDPVFLVKSTGILYKPTGNRMALLYGDCNPEGAVGQPNLFINE